ncbi:MAG: right-handed parallel beta-helix repeat-containing protein [Candidatus Hodarchaeales archaeon]|jgi:parallel beta-helix repeat protein
MKDDRKTEMWDHPPLDREMFDNRLLLRTRYPRPSPLLTPYDPIVINNDTDFSTQGWTGSGASGDPYQLANLEIINTTFFGIDIRNTRAHFVINNSWIEGTTVGISLVNVSNGLIVSSTCTNHSLQGVSFLNSWNCTSRNNTIADCVTEGFWLEQSNETKILNNSIVNVGSAGIFFKDSVNNTLSGNTIASAGQEGIYLEHTNYSAISSNIVTNDSWGAIKIRFSVNSTISNNTAFESGKYELYFSSNSTVAFNTLISANSGIKLVESGNSSVSENVLTDSDGIHLTNSSRCTVQNNNVSHSSARGIWLWYSANATIKGNLLTNCSGIYASYSGHSTIQENIAQDLQAAGVSVEYSNFSIIKDNSFTNISFSNAMDLSGSHNSIVSNNNATIGGGITLWDSAYTLISENIFINTSGIRVETETSRNCRVSANVLGNNTFEGLYLGADNCILSNNLIQSSIRNGIQVNSADNSSITGNLITNSGENGLGLEHVVDSKIETNSIANSSRHGLLLWNCNYTHLRGNNVTQSEDQGIEISESHHCTVINCKVIGSQNIGIALNSGTSNCTLWGNILAASIETNAEDWSGTNQWDNGQAGNFWDDYTELDENGDGIGDKPYLVTQYLNEDNFWVNITDRFPLMQLRGFIVHTVKVKYPNGGELLSGMVTVAWGTYGLNAASTRFEFLYSDDLGNSWFSIISGITGTSYDWDTSMVAKSYEFNYLIKIIATDGQITVEDISDNTFTVKKWSTVGRGTLSSPGMTLIPLFSAIIILFFRFRAKEQR